MKSYTSISNWISVKNNIFWLNWIYQKTWLYHELSPFFLYLDRMEVVEVQVCSTVFSSLQSIELKDLSIFLSTFSGSFLDYFKILCRSVQYRYFLLWSTSSKSSLSIVFSLGQSRLIDNTSHLVKIAEISLSILVMRIKLVWSFFLKASVLLILVPFMLNLEDWIYLINCSYPIGIVHDIKEISFCFTTWSWH